MAMPANIRVSARFPFPALVTGAAPITVTKLNGVWTIGFTIAGLAAQTPPIGNYPTDYLLVYDAVAQSYFRMSLAAALAARVQRSVIASPIVIASNDQILNCNIAAPAACALPTAVSRAGVPLTFKDVGAQFGVNNLTITPFAAETIDGAATLVLKANRQGVTLVPFNDGTNVGWAIE
jgi:hypothetical protein